MNENKIQALLLRKSGLSYGEISKQLNIPKSTLSYFLKDIKLSVRAQERINNRTHKASVCALIKRNINQTALAEKRSEIIRVEAKKEFKKLVSEPLFLSGVSLYWAEGYKKGAYGSNWKSIDFANSDPKMVRVIIKFFEKYFDIKKENLKVQIIAHSNLKLKESLKFWSDFTGISKNNFIKTCYCVNKNSTGKRDKKRLPYGTVHIRINNVKLFFRMIGWIDGLIAYFKV